MVNLGEQTRETTKERFGLSHRLIGSLAVLMAMTNIFLGINEFTSELIPMLLFAAFVGVTLTYIGFLQYLAGRAVSFLFASFWFQKTSNLSLIREMSILQSLTGLMASSLKSRL